MSADLESRIAPVLAGEGTTDAVAVLAADVKVEIDRLVDEHAEAEATSLDPLTPAGAAAEAFAKTQLLHFTWKRLTLSLKAVEERLKALRQADAAEAARVEFYDAKAERDTLADDLAKFYPAAVSQFLVLLDRMSASNARIKSTNYRVPPGEGWLRSAEETARGPLSAAAPDLHLALRLPAWRQGSPYFPVPHGGV